MKRELRPYQSSAIEALRQKLRDGHRRVVVQAATGAGKTLISAEIVSMVLAKGNRIGFAVPAISLIDQTVRSFWDHGIRDIGVIQSDHPLTRSEAPVQIASVQTLMRRKMPDVSMWIIDECHLQFRFLTDWMAEEENQRVPIVGLSATPWAKGMGKTWKSLIVAATTRDLIGQGYLSPYRAFAPSKPDLSSVPMIAGDYHEGKLSEVMQDAKLTGDIVRTWIEMGEGRPTLVFCVDCAHAAAVQRQFEESGIPAGYCDAYVPADQRDKLGLALRDGGFKVICNVGTLTTGVDWPWVSCIVLCRPTKSEMTFVQISGRGLRLYPQGGKSDMILLDHSNTTLELGLPCSIHHELLDDGKRKKASSGLEKKAKECSKCGALRSPGVSRCTSCGHEIGEKIAALEVAEGRLQQVGGKEEKHPPGMVRLGGSLLPRGSFFAQLKSYELQKGYKPGWSSNQYRDLLGTWPNHYKDSDPQEISHAVRSWIKSRQIAYANRKDAAE